MSLPVNYELSTFYRSNDVKITCAFTFKTNILLHKLYRALTSKISAMLTSFSFKFDI